MLEQKSGGCLSKLLSLAFSIAMLLSEINGPFLTHIQRVTYWGEEITINLLEGEKLSDWGWTADFFGSSVWVKTRPRAYGELPETYTAREKSSHGWFEGKIVFVENFNQEGEKQ